MWRIARYLGYSGSYPAARDMFGLIADAHRDSDAYGPEHLDTLSARHSHARWTGEAGDAAGARDQFAALLPIRERVLGPEHPNTLITRSDLASWTGGAGDAASDASWTSESEEDNLQHPACSDDEPLLICGCCFAAVARLCRAGAPAAPRSGAALISYTAGFCTGSYPAFRISLIEKPTV